MPTINSQLRDFLLKHSHYVYSFENGTINNMVEPYQNAKAEIVKKISDLEDYGQGYSLPYRMDRLNTRLNEVDMVLKNATQDSVYNLSNDLNEFAMSEKDYVETMLSNPFGQIGINTVRLPYEQIYEIVNTPIGGELYHERMVHRYGEAMRNIKSNLTQSVIQGEDMAKASRYLFGIGKGMGGVIGNRLAQQSAVIARTEIMRVSNAVSERVYNENKDVLKGVSWISTLDRRTCLECGSLDGRTFYYNKGEKPPQRPLHPLCRCTLVPCTKSWKELGADQKIKEPDAGTRPFTYTGEKPPKGSRQYLAQQDKWAGDVPATEKYPDWLRRMNVEDPDFVKDILGTKRYDLWSTGQIDFQDMVKNNKVLQLSDLERKMGKIELGGEIIGKGGPGIGPPLNLYMGSDVLSIQKEIAAGKTEFWFSSNWSVAGKYGPNIHQTQVRMKNPMILRDVIHDDELADWVKAARLSKNDGLIAQRVRDEGIEHITVVAFSPEQIVLRAKGLPLEAISPTSWQLGDKINAITMGDFITSLRKKSWDDVAKYLDDVLKAQHLSVAQHNLNEVNVMRYLYEKGMTTAEMKTQIAEYVNIVKGKLYGKGLPIEIKKLNFNLDSSFGLEQANEIKEGITNSFSEIIDRFPKLNKFELDRITIKNSELVFHADGKPATAFYKHGEAILSGDRPLAGSGVLQTGKFQIGNDLNSLSIHEWAHHIYARGVALEFKPNLKGPGGFILSEVWEDIFKSLGRDVIGKRVSTYAMTNKYECFAESFMTYTHKGYKPGILPKSIEDFFDYFLPKKSLSIKTIQSIPAELEAKMTARQIAAHKNVWVKTAQDQSITEISEKEVAQWVKGNHIVGNRPFDVFVDREFIEVKTLLNNSTGYNHQIQMHVESIPKKTAFEKAYKVRPHTIVIDKTPGSETYGKVFYREGHAKFRLTNMIEVGDSSDPLIGDKLTALVKKGAKPVPAPVYARATTPEVTSLKSAEKWAQKNLGVKKVDFDNLEPKTADLFNQYAKGAIEELKIKPTAIRFDASLFTGANKRVVALSFEDGTVAFNPNLIRTTKELQTVVKQQSAIGQFATDSKGHIFRHELAHQRYFQLGGTEASAAKKINTRELYKAIGRTDLPDYVSKYAMRNEGEFYAEMLAKRLDGVKLHPVVEKFMNDIERRISKGAGKSVVGKGLPAKVGQKAATGPMKVKDWVVKDDFIPSKNQFFISYGKTDIHPKVNKSLATKCIDSAGSELSRILKIDSRLKTLVEEGTNARFTLRIEEGKVFISESGNKVAGAYRDRRLRISSGLQKGKPELHLGSSNFDIGSDYNTVIRHEFGHHVEEEVLSSADQGKWFSLHSQLGGDDFFARNVSKYASTSEGEAFAESFSAYTSPLYKSGMLPKGIEDFFKSYLGGVK